MSPIAEPPRPTSSCLRWPGSGGAHANPDPIISRPKADHEAHRTSAATQASFAPTRSSTAAVQNLCSERIPATRSDDPACPPSVDPPDDRGGDRGRRAVLLFAHIALHLAR